LVSGAEGESCWNSVSGKQKAIVADHVLSLCREEDLDLDYKHGEYVDFNRYILLIMSAVQEPWFRGNERLSMRERWMKIPEIHNGKKGLRPFNGRNYPP
jgi:hypothetical protein